jgi:uncharacterized SAM-binding protein YcdF (DUF218 family)
MQAGTIRPKILIVLGAPNDSRGRLSKIAKSRADTALRLYKEIPYCKLLLTGGFGRHFNISPMPHAWYLARYLRRQGVKESDIVEFALSSNTIEDALLSKTIIERLGCRTVYVITTGFHMPRARLIFERVFAPLHLRFVEAPVKLADKTYKKLCKHEQEAVAKILDGTNPLP